MPRVSALVYTAVGGLTESRVDKTELRGASPVALPSERITSMTESNTRPQSILLRVEMVRARMHSWGLTSGDAGYVDPADPATLDPADSRYVRADPSSVSAYYDRIRAEADAPG
jgi:hypothetical protein